MIVIGLTGSIGMGKSATAKMFAEAGIPVYDADLAVHALYRGAAVAPVEAAFPGTARNGEIDRTKLAAYVVGKPDAMRRLEEIVHPLVRTVEREFLSAAAERHRMVVLDIPLLLETGRAGDVDAIVVVSAAADKQRTRVLARPGMTEEKLDALIAAQTPDAEKRRRAHFLVLTDFDFDAARRQVAGIIRALSAMRG
ncbi:MAG: dephospho-CoA kinase [Hyphomicrobiales bacterium]|nr:dephospho-CoA kinase [Hyphomicrobiales bacterium]